MFGHRLRIVRDVTFPKEVSDVSDVANRIVTLLEELVEEEQLCADLCHLLFNIHSVEKVVGTFLRTEFLVLIRILCFFRCGMHCRC